MTLQRMQSFQMEHVSTWTGPLLASRHSPVRWNFSAPNQGHLVAQRSREKREDVGGSVGSRRPLETLEPKL